MAVCRRSQGQAAKGDKTERGDYWLWACIDADTKLVLSHRIGKRDWITGHMFIKDVRDRVSGPVQIATDNLPAYPFHIRAHFGYEGYSYGMETKIFGEPQLLDGAAARFGRNEGVRKIDFVQLQRDQKKAATTGTPVKLPPAIARNSRCHCGSGKKFKNCHGKIAA